MTGRAGPKGRAGLMQEWGQQSLSQAIPSLPQSTGDNARESVSCPTSPMANLLRRGLPAINTALQMLRKEVLFFLELLLAGRHQIQVRNRKYCWGPVSSMWPPCPPSGHFPVSLGLHQADSRASAAIVIPGQGPINCHPRALSRQLPAC